MTEELMPLSEDLLSLLSDEQAAPAMPAAMQAKISARLAESLLQTPTADASDAGGDASSSASGTEATSASADGGASVLSSGAEASASLSPLASLAAKPALLAATAFGVGASAGIGGTLLLSQPEATPAAPKASAALIVAADAGPATLPTPDARAFEMVVLDAAGLVPPSETVPKPKTVDTSNRPPVENRRDENLAAERSILEVARTAITRGNSATALQALKKHARQHRRGQLAEERDALWVQALVLARNYEQAKSKGQRFRTKYPKSLFKPVVDHALADLP